jgi:ABC-type phosphate transport system substrate-binding protein
MAMRTLVKLLLASLMWLTALAALSDELGDSLVVVVNPDSGVNRVDREDVINIFMGRYHQLPSGITAIPVDFQAAKEDFYAQLINKSLPEVNAFWARLVFSGRAMPPLQIRTAEELLAFVARNKGAIGYMHQKDVDSSVRILNVFSTAIDEQALETNP